MNYFTFTYCYFHCERIHYFYKGWLILPLEPNYNAVSMEEIFRQLEADCIERELTSYNGGCTLTKRRKTNRTKNGMINPCYFFTLHCQQATWVWCNTMESQTWKVKRTTGGAATIPGSEPYLYTALTRIRAAVYLDQSRIFRYIYGSDQYRLPL